MNKTETPSSFPNSQEVGGRSAAAPTGFVQRTVPVNAAAGQSSISPTRPAQHKGGSAYVDPYLFETGYYTSRAEYEELSSTSASRIELRAEVENARPKRQRRLKP